MIFRGGWCESIERAREAGRAVPVLLGPNCLGVQSRPGRYDTFFIPENKLDKRRGAARGVAWCSCRRAARSSSRV